MNRDDAKTFLVAGLIAIAILLGAICMAGAVDSPAVDCALVRTIVAQYGKEKALAWASHAGLSPEQIAAARKCLK